MSSPAAQPPSRAVVLIEKAVAAAAGLSWLAFSVDLLIEKAVHPLAFQILTNAFKYGMVASAAAFALLRIIESVRAGRFRKLDRWSYLPALTLAVVIAYGAVRLPFLLRPKAGVRENQSAQQVGTKAEFALKRYYAQHGTYQAGLDELMKIDPSIKSSPEVTFKFDEADQSGYKFTTRYSRSPMIYRFSSKGAPLPPSMKALFPKPKSKPSGGPSAP